MHKTNTAPLTLRTPELRTHFSVGASTPILASILLLIAGSTLSAVAEVRLPSLLGSHMVLQQKSEVTLWGWCGPAENISVLVDWDTNVFRATGSGTAKWSLKLKTPDAGGPYKIIINGGNAIILEDVMIGEVWVCGGQSNMEWSGDQGLKQSLDEAPHATNASLRFFYVPKATAAWPQEDCRGSWKVCSPEEMKHFSAIGYFFGKGLQQELNVPIGLVNANWGGTPAEVWTPADSVMNNAALKTAAAMYHPTPWWPNAPGEAYNAMIHPLTRYVIAGAIWYQGEGNVGNYATYESLFTTMITAWRKAWQKDFPFYFVQIAPFAGYGNKNVVGALLREAQTKSLSLPQTGMIVISDLVDNVDDIHPQNKTGVARRLANLALVKTYGKKGSAYQSPLYQKMAVEEDKVRIYFEHADQGLTSQGGEPTEFTVAGEDKIFQRAQARIEGSTVLVWHDDIKHPKAVRFGFDNAARPNLMTTDGLPVNLFRTDDWPVDTEAIKK